MTQSSLMSYWLLLHFLAQSTPTFFVLRGPGSEIASSPGSYLITAKSDTQPYLLRQSRGVMQGHDVCFGGEEQIISLLSYRPSDDLINQRRLKRTFFFCQQMNALRVSVQ